MGRVLAAVGAVASLAVLVASGWAAVRAEDGVGDRVVAEYGTVATPFAVPQPAPVAAGEPAAEPAAAAPLPTTRLPASQIPAPAPQVPIRSGSLAGLQEPPPPAPVRLRIGGISLDAPVEPVGYDARRGEMEVPRSRELVGWYRHGPAPGAPGSAVLAAHVDWNGRAGAFFDLVDVRPGTRIVVSYADGTERHFRAEALRQYDKADLPTAQLFAKEGRPVLTLVTCGGEFDAAAGSYRENVVVRAVPIDPADAPLAS